MKARRAGILYGVLGVLSTGLFATLIWMLWEFVPRASSGMACWGCAAVSSWWPGFGLFSSAGRLDILRTMCVRPSTQRLLAGSPKISPL